MTEHEPNGSEKSANSTEDYQAMFDEAQPQRVEDVEKARVMAAAEDHHRELSIDEGLKAARESQDGKLKAREDWEEVRARDYDRMLAAKARGGSHTMVSSQPPWHHEKGYLKKADEHIDKAVDHQLKAEKQGEDAARRFDEGKSGEPLLRRIAKKLTPWRPRTYDSMRTSSWGRAWAQEQREARKQQREEKSGER